MQVPRVKITIFQLPGHSNHCKTVYKPYFIKMKALIIVDVQNDFLPGGSLEVPMGDVIIPLINKLQERFELVVATQDWHPADHGSFASKYKDKKVFDKTTLGGVEQILWPDHCVQGSKGAKISSELNTHAIEGLFRKGTDPGIDSYSGFFDNGKKKSTGLAGYLKEKGVSDVYICGLAGDVCVAFTTLDAIDLNFNTFLIKDATRPIDKNSFYDMINNINKKGGHIIDSAKII